MKKIYIFWICCFFIFVNCKKATNSAEIEKWKAEVVQTEQDFNDLAQKEGIVKAFQTYAAKEGVIKRGNDIIKGNEAITNWYLEHAKPDETLTWQPDFVDVSKSGELAYTYGSVVFTSVDSIGTKKESRGKFHTVWKKQTDGRWKFVWD